MAMNCLLMFLVCKDLLRKSDILYQLYLYAVGLVMPLTTHVYVTIELSFWFQMYTTIMITVK